ncbi:Plasma membrane t-SNARE, secretory vesicle fusion [Rhodotorula toruloides]
MAREAGAKRVIMASCAPPIRYPCVYGIDMPSRHELVAHDRTEDEIAEYIGADHIIFQSLDDLVSSCQRLNVASYFRLLTPTDVRHRSAPRSTPAHPGVRGLPGCSLLLDSPAAFASSLSLDSCGDMAGLLKLPGSTAASKDGYASLDQPIKQHTVSAGGIKDVPIELGDLANDVYFDEVARIRDAIRALDDTISTLQTKQTYSLQAPSESLAVEITTLSSRLSQDISYHRSRIAELGQQVGKDEARRGHWENLKAALQRMVEKWQRAEQSHREKVRDKIGRQMRIVNPDVTDEEVKQAVDTSAGAQTQVFQQAIMGARSAAAKSALTEAESRRSELVQIEETLVQLAALMQQVADLVVQQDVQITHIESTAAGVEADVEQGVKQIGLAKVSAAAARHKRKMCAAFGFLLLLVLIIVVVIEVKQGSGGGGGGKEEVKTETVSAAASATSHAARYR